MTLLECLSSVVEKELGVRVEDWEWDLRDEGIDFLGTVEGLPRAVFVEFYPSTGQGHLYYATLLANADALGLILDEEVCEREHKDVSFIVKCNV